MDSRFIYFDADYVIKIHDEIIIKISGGLLGVKNRGSIDSILEHIKNDEYYPEFEDKITHLVFSIIKHHAFNDGNKRTSIAAGASFLAVNDFGIYVEKFIREMENIVVLVAENKIDKVLLKDIIAETIYNDSFSESLKLKILNAIS